MGTYDTKGGSPISPNIPEPVISQWEEEALEALEELERVTTTAKEVLNDLFLEVVMRRHPIGSMVDTRRDGRVLSGHLHGYFKGKVLRYFNDNCFNYSRPESSRVGIEIQLCNKAGALTEHLRTLWVDVVPNSSYSEKSDRDILCELIGDAYFHRGALETDKV